jgi:hypothetical protein
MVKLRLSVVLILRWADAHHRRTGRWPGAHSGPVAGRAGEHWGALESALRHGWRGLPGGDTLARLLVRHGRRPPPWTGRAVKAWTAAEDALVRSLPPAEAARRIARPLRAVYHRRYLLGVPDGRKKYG